MGEDDIQLPSFNHQGQKYCGCGGRGTVKAATGNSTANSASVDGVPGNVLGIHRFLLAGQKPVPVEND
jgi:hypothetical protein